jgi:hypothetical protein
MDSVCIACRSETSHQNWKECVLSCSFSEGAHSCLGFVAHPAVCCVPTALDRLLHTRLNTGLVHVLQVATVAVSTSCDIVIQCMCHHPYLALGQKWTACPPAC